MLPRLRRNLYMCNNYSDMEPGTLYILEPWMEVIMQRRNTLLGSCQFKGKVCITCWERKYMLNIGINYLEEQPMRISITTQNFILNQPMSTELSKVVSPILWVSSKTCPKSLFQQIKSNIRSLFGLVLKLLKVTYIPMLFNIIHYQSMCKN